MAWDAVHGNLRLLPTFCEPAAGQRVTAAALPLPRLQLCSWPVLRRTEVR